MKFSVHAMLKPMMALLLGALMLPASAQAQFSDSYNFLKAVRDSNGAKATSILNEPGTNIIDTKDLTTGETALHITVARRDIGWTGFMLSKGARPDTRDKQGNTPLILAARLGFAEGAQLLIAHKANVNATNSRGETPLIVAVQNRDLRTARLLLAAGADPDRADTLAGLSARDYAKRDQRSAAILRAMEELQKKKPLNQMGP